MSDTKVYYHLVKKLSTSEGFIDEWRDRLGEKTNKAIYEEVEEEFMTIFGRYKFSNYDSFKRTVRYYHKKK